MQHSSRKEEVMKRILLYVALVLSTLPTTFLLAQPIDRPVMTAPKEQSECQIASSPVNANTMMATWNDFQTDSLAGYGFSTDGGLTWANSVIALRNLFPRPWYTIGDPSCAMDHIGTGYYCYLAINPDQGGREYRPGSRTLQIWALIGSTKRCNQPALIKISPG